MRATDNPGKVLVLSALILLTVSTAGAASIDTLDGDVWMNEATGDTLEVSGSCDIADAERRFLIENDRMNESLYVNTTGNVSTADLRGSLSPASYNVSMTCHNGTAAFTDTSGTEGLDLKRLNLDVVDSGVGFVGEQLKSSKTAGLDFLTPARIMVNISGPGSIDVGALGEANVDIPGGTATLPSGFDNYETVDDGVQITLTPLIKSYFSEDEGMPVEFQYDGGDVRKDISTTIYRWKVRKAGGNECHPANRIGYSTIKNEGQYDYCLEVKYEGKDPGELAVNSHNFKLVIEEQVSGGTFPDYERVETIDGQDIFAVEEVNSDNWNYRLAVSNFNPIEDAIGTGIYRFRLEFRYEEQEAGSILEYPVDTIVVDKGLTFSGWVQDSGGSGVPALMELRRDQVTTQVRSQQSGYFEKDINHATYDQVNVLFETDRSVPSSTLELEDVDLADASNTDLDTQGSVVYEYGDQPGNLIDINGLNPVNMMAVGLGYDIGGDAHLSMRYSSSGINPNEAQVYECVNWNFGSNECLGSWESVSHDLSQTRVTSWVASVDDLELYTVGDDRKDTLMNAYVVGVPAELQVRNQLSLNSAEIPASGDLEVSGTITSSTGQTVADADVTLELLRDGVIEKTYEATTDSAGYFELSGQAPDEPGSYRLRVSSSKMPYDRLDETSDQRIEVFYETGMALSAPENPEIRTGETSRLQFTLQNTGQVEVSDVSVDVSGIDDRYYRLQDTPDTVPADQPRTVTLELDLPSDYGSGVTGPTITLDATGQTDDGEVEASARMLTSFAEDTSESNTSETESPETGSDTTEGDDSDEGSFSDGFVTPAGNLIQSQSDVNIALGLILIFALILAVAIKKRDTNGPSRRFGDTDRRGPRKSRIERPKISASNGSNGEPAPTNGGSQDDESSDESESEEDDAGSDEVIETDDGTYMYDGKEFDTKEGVELYRNMQD